MNNQIQPDRKTQILNAAEQRFARFGLSKVTMDEIAADVGMSKAALYYYFKTKEDIFREVIAREQAQFIDGAEKIIARDTAASEKLRQYGRQRILFFNEIANLNLLGIQAWLDVKPFMSDLFKEFAGHEARLLTRIVKHGKRAAEFSAASPEKTAGLILNVLRGWGHHAFKPLLSGERPDLRSIQDEYDLLISMLLTGLLTR
jgi:TetR/AcrR family transcriptional regulator